MDKTWIKVLALTINFHKENRSYYKFAENGKDVKILDINIMNSLIEKYKGFNDVNYENCQAFEKNLIKWN